MRPQPDLFLTTHLSLRPGRPSLMKRLYIEKTIADFWISPYECSNASIYDQVTSADYELRIALEELIITEPINAHLMEDILMCRNLAPTQNSL